MTFTEFDNAVSVLDNLYNEGEITQKEWALQYQLLIDQYNNTTEKL